MKLTFDLPADRVDRLKARAVKDGTKLNDLIVQACSTFLSNEMGDGRDKKSKSPFPIFKGVRKVYSRANTELTPERIDEILWGGGRGYS